MSEARVRSENVVVLCTDAQFVVPCAFLIDKLAADPARDRYDVILVHDAVPEPMLQRVKAGAARDFGVIPFDGGRLAGLRTTALLSRAAYMRLCLNELLPAQYRRILYLDADIYPACESVAHIFAFDLGGEAFAAVEDAWLRAELDCPRALPGGRRPWAEASGVRGYKAGLGLDPADRYMNTGVMLIDRTRWVEAKLSDRAFHFAAAHPDRCLYADQSALNAVADGRWAELSPRYNFQPSHALAGLERGLDPALRHFAGPFKPWNSDFWGPGLSTEYRAWRERRALPDAFPAPTNPPPSTDRQKTAPGRLVRRLLGRRDTTRGSSAEDRAALRHSALTMIRQRRFIDMSPEAQRTAEAAVARRRPA